MMRKDRIELEKRMDQAQADTIMVANRELLKKCADLQEELLQATEGQKALIL